MPVINLVGDVVGISLTDALMHLIRSGMSIRSIDDYLHLTDEHDYYHALCACFHRVDNTTLNDVVFAVSSLNYDRYKSTILTPDIVLARFFIY